MTANSGYYEEIQVTDPHDLSATSDTKGEAVHGIGNSIVMRDLRGKQRTEYESIDDVMVKGDKLLTRRTYDDHVVDDTPMTFSYDDIHGPVTPMASADEICHKW